MKRTPLKRKAPLSRRQPRRDWTDARRKVGHSDGCRVCGYMGDQLEAAHTVGREHDDAVHWGPDRPGSSQFTTPVLWVNPDSIIPLCRRHHQQYDAHEIDVLPMLTLDEQLDAVKRAGGLELARVRLCPTAYRQAA